MGIGTFDYNKGHDLLVDAFARVARERADVDLVIVGRSGHLLRDLAHQIDAHGLTRRVHLLPDRSHTETLALLQSCEGFVLASRNEGFSLVLLEAAAFSRPVVATAVGGITELLSTPGLGWIVPADDPQRLAEALSECLADRTEAAARGARLHAHVSARYSWQAACAEYLVLAQTADPANSPMPSAD